MISGQKQSGGDHSVNVQANTVSVGLSLEEARIVALGVFRENFIELQAVARAAAEERAEKLTDDVLRRIATENPKLLDQVSDPSSAHAFFQAQKSAALSGEEELSHTLSELVIGHLSESSRTRRQIALAQAIDVTGLLTVRQIDILIIHFITANVRSVAIRNRAELLEHYTTFFTPVAERTRDITPEDVDAEIPYLEYHRCLRVREGQRTKYSNPRDQYSALFCKGFDFDGSNGFAERNNLSPEERESVLSLLMTCPDHSEKVQLRGMDREINEHLLQNSNLRPEIKTSLLDDTTNALFSYDETKTFLEDAAPDAAFLFKLSYDSKLVSSEITPTGTAIAYSAAKRLLSINSPLEIWLK